MIKIGHEGKVEVVPCANFGEALVACHSSPRIYVLQKSIIRPPIFKQSSEERELEEMCRQEIPGECEGKIVRKTLAVALLDRSKAIADLRHELNEQGFFLASITAAAAFVPILRQRGVSFGPIPHLGSLIRHREYFAEACFVSSPKGRPQVRVLFPETKIDPRNSIIVERVEKKTR